MSRSVSSNRNRGTTYLEVQVAFTVLGVALAGLAPLVSSQLNLIRKIEESPSALEINYLVPAQHLGPSENQWLRKLGCDATITTEPTFLSAGEPPEPTQRVILTFSTVTGPGPSVSAVVSVTPILPADETNETLEEGSSEGLGDVP